MLSQLKGTSSASLTGKSDICAPVPATCLGQATCHAVRSSNTAATALAQLSNRACSREAGPLPRGHGTGGVVVTAQKLSFQHKQIVVASRGFLELVTADEVALRLHSMRKVRGRTVWDGSHGLILRIVSLCGRINELNHKALCLLQAGGTGVSKAGFTERGPAATSPASSGNSIGSSRSSNMAETLVLYAMGKLAAKLDR